MSNPLPLIRRLLPLPRPLITVVLLTPLLALHRHPPTPPSIVVFIVLGVGGAAEDVALAAAVGLEVVVPPITHCTSLQGSLNLLQVYLLVLATVLLSLLLPFLWDYLPSPLLRLKSPPHP